MTFGIHGTDSENTARAVNTVICIIWTMSVENHKRTSAYGVGISVDIRHHSYNCTTHNHTIFSIFLSFIVEKYLSIEYDF